MAGSSGGVFDGTWNYIKGSTNYLNINITYWTMTPAGGYVSYDGPGDLRAYMLGIESSGSFDDHGAIDIYGVRSVVNLKSNAIKYGTGTSSDPYRVTEN